VCASLPVSIRFPDLVTTQQPLRDERQQFTRKRFLDCHELLYRPSFYLTLNYPGLQDLIVALHPKSPHNQSRDPAKLEADVRVFMLALQYTYWSIAADRGVLFQHTPIVWHDVRHHLTDVLILRAAAKAGMDLPMGGRSLWRRPRGTCCVCAPVMGGKGVFATGGGDPEKGCAEVTMWARGIVYDDACM